MCNQKQTILPVPHVYAYWTLSLPNANGKLDWNQLQVEVERRFIYCVQVLHSNTVPNHSIMKLYEH